MWHVYFRGGQFIVPVVAQTEAGYYLDVEPAEGIAGDAKEALRTALEDVIRQGNPRVPTPTWPTFPTQEAFSLSGVKSWATFEKKSICWTITREGSGHVVAVTGRAANGRWKDDPERTVRLGEGEGAAAIVSVIMGHLRGRPDV